MKYAHGVLGHRVTERLSSQLGGAGAEKTNKVWVAHILEGQHPGRQRLHSGWHLA